MQCSVFHYIALGAYAHEGCSGLLVCLFVCTLVLCVWVYEARSFDDLYRVPTSGNKE